MALHIHYDALHPNIVIQQLSARPGEGLGDLNYD